MVLFLSCFGTETKTSDIVTPPPNLQNGTGKINGEYFKSVLS